MATDADDAEAAAARSLREEGEAERTAAEQRRDAFVRGILAGKLPGDVDAWIARAVLLFAVGVCDVLPSQTYVAAAQLLAGEQLPTGYLGYGIVDELPDALAVEAMIGGRNSADTDRRHALALLYCEARPVIFRDVTDRAFNGGEYVGGQWLAQLVRWGYQAHPIEVATSDDFPDRATARDLLGELVVDPAVWDAEAEDDAPPVVDVELPPLVRGEPDPVTGVVEYTAAADELPELPTAGRDADAAALVDAAQAVDVDTDPAVEARELDAMATAAGDGFTDTDPGHEPHTAWPTPEQVAELKRPQLFELANNLGVETTPRDTAASMRGKILPALAERTDPAAGIA